MLITIFDGTTQEIKYKNDLDVSEFEYNRDLTSLNKSKLKGIETAKIEEMKIKLGDYILSTLIMNKKEYDFVGKITDIKYTNNLFELSFIVNSDINNNEVYMPNNVLNGYDITDNNYSAVEVHAITNASCTTTDKNLTLDTLNRQAMRKNSMSEVVTFLENDKKIIVDLKDVQDSLIYEVRYDDPGLKYNLSYGTDTFNWYRMRLKETDQYIDTYLYEDGTTGNDINLAVRPLIQKVEFLEDTSYNQEHADSVLKGQEYANKLEITTIINNNIYGLNYNSDILGRKLLFYGPNEVEINTFISGLKIKNNIMTIVCGLTRTKLSEKIKREV